MTNRSSRRAKDRPPVVHVPGACPVCNEVPQSGKRYHHFRSEHPSYWRFIVLRLAAPWMLLAVIVAMASNDASAGWYMLALVAFLTVGMWAQFQTARMAGRESRLSGGQRLRGAGMGLLLISAGLIAVAILFLLTR